MRVATCTPVDFPADAQFFGRDSGLLCRGFQAAGHDAFVVMPGSIRPDDEPGVVRGAPQELECESWWRALGVDLVILYAWGDPRYRATAEAIRSAGICLVQSLDTAGLTTPYGNTREWWRCLSGMVAAESDPSRKLRHLARALRDLFPSIYEKKRLAMIDCSDRVAVVSPPAARSIAKYACSLGYPQLASKILVVPHPVSQIMKPSKGLKPRKVLVVGRWHAEDKAQKDPELTMTVLGIFLKTHADWTAEVVGRGSTALQALAASWDADSRNRLTLTESVPRNELVERYQHSRILLCCSRFESFHISSAEAVCCGCSIIVADHPLLASTAWFTTRDSGTLSRKRQASHLASALGCEAAAWAHGQRQATGISANWTKTLHAADVAGALIEGACPESAQRDAPH